MTESKMSLSKLDYSYDLFISHASEDKNAFVRPLAEILRSMGLRIWYDEFSLNIGDSLSRSIDKGLSNSRFGLIVISPSFMTKNWPAHELAGLASRQVSERNIILPIWHGVSAQMVKDFSPTLADLVAIRTADNDPNGIAFQILKTVRPDIYETASRTEIENSINVEATNLLQDEIKERLKDSINRKLPTNGRGEISATVMREVFFEVIDYVSAVSNFHRSNAANQFQNRQQRSPVENC